MAIVINGSGTVTGISVGGLPDDIVDSGTLADDAVDSAQLASGSVDTAHIAADQITSAILPAGTVLQVVEGGMDGTADHSAGATTYSTLFSASLTNVAASSVVVGWVNIQGKGSATNQDYAIACFQGVRVMGGGTATDSCDSGLIMNMRYGADDSVLSLRGAGMFIDSSPPTGTVQYDVKSINEGTFTIGRSHWTGDQRHLRPRNNIILMEIAV